MKLNYLLVLLLPVIITCKQKDFLDPQATINKNLSGSWTGVYTSQQIGACNVGYGDASVESTAIWEVVGDSIRGVVKRRFINFLSPQDFTGRFDGDTVRVSEFVYVTCNSVPRTYTRRFKGTIIGDTLTVVSIDSICPLQNCIYLRTLKLARQ